MSIMVDGVQVSLPTYEEAVAGCSGAPPSLPPLTAEDQRVEASQPQPPPSSQLALSSQADARAQAPGQQHAELAMVHRGPSPSSPSSSSSSSASLSSASWGPLLGATAAGAHRGERPSSTHSEQHSLLLQASQLDFADGTAFVSLFLSVFVHVSAMQGCVSQNYHF